MGGANGERALITGAGNGIGEATALALAERGYSLALLDLDLAAAQEVASRCGPGAEAFEADITKQASLDEATSAAVEAMGGLDVCFANAGIATTGTLPRIDPEVFAVQVDVNLIGTFRTVHACLPHLLRSRGYVAINSSMSAVITPPGLGAYGATKAGVEAMGDTLRREVKHLGVDVGVVYLLWIATDMVLGAERHGDTFSAIRESMSPPFRRTITPEKAAAAIVRGIERRKRRIYAPRWVAAAYRLRGVVPGLLERDAVAAAAAIDEASQRDLSGGDGVDGAVRRDVSASAAAADAVRERHAEG